MHASAVKCNVYTADIVSVLMCVSAHFCVILCVFFCILITIEILFDE